MDPITLALTIAGVLGPTAAVSWYIAQYRNVIKARQASLFMQLYDIFCQKDFQMKYADIVFRHEWRDFDDWMQKYGPFSDLDSFSTYVAVSAYFEGIGVLVKRKLIDIELVNDILSSQILLFWEKIEDVTINYRRLLNLSQLWEWFEYLYNEIKKKQKYRASA